MKHVSFSCLNKARDTYQNSPQNTSFSLTFTAAGPRGQFSALSSRRALERTTLSRSARPFPLVLLELLFFLFLHFLPFLRHRFAGADGAAVFVLRRTLGVHDVPVTVHAAPNSLHGAQTLALQHFLEVGAGAAGLAVTVSPGHEAVKALWVRRERRWCLKKQNKSNTIGSRICGNDGKENRKKKGKVYLLFGPRFTEDSGYFFLKVRQNVTGKTPAITTMWRFRYGLTGALGFLLQLAAG